MDMTSRADLGPSRLVWTGGGWLAARLAGHEEQDEEGWRSVVSGIFVRELASSVDRLHKTTRPALAGP